MHPFDFSGALETIVFLKLFVCWIYKTLFLYFALMEKWINLV